MADVPENAEDPDENEKPKLDEDEVKPKPDENEHKPKQSGGRGFIFALIAALLLVLLSIQLHHIQECESIITSKIKEISELRAHLEEDMKTCDKEKYIKDGELKVEKDRHAHLEEDRKTCDEERSIMNSTLTKQLEDKQKCESTITSKINEISELRALEEDMKTCDKEKKYFEQ